MRPAELDLTAYLARIGLQDDPSRPTLALLRMLVARHTRTIPFENLDILLGRPIRIDLGSVQEKLVGHRRGGYCFEQNTLFQAVLDRLGFQTTMLMGRVVAGGSEEAEAPRAHLAIRVSLPEGDWLADVGFGNMTPTAPLRLSDDTAQSTPHEAFRLQPRSEGTLLAAERHHEWRALYRFTREPTVFMDHVVANWFTSTAPDGPFSSNLIVARPGEGWRKTLFNGLFTLRRLTGARQTRTIDSAHALRATLDRDFNLAVDGAEADHLFAVMQGSAADNRVAAAFEG